MAHSKRWSDAAYAKLIAELQDEISGWACEPVPPNTAALLKRAEQAIDSLS